MEIKEKKSAKDIAFDKERAKYRKQIRELEQEGRALSNTIKSLNGMVHEKENKIAELKDWIERLLEYTELSEDEMRKIIQKDKDAVETLEKVMDIEKVISRFGLFCGGR